ncbi:hypothetical protein Pan216_34610 [Planctomycetes bacterium Pan216]|uniref:3-keto-alpha-glucoside-1,2-lyase/3-keto-2-hydroxy-glucal hydratase domain-containing protein n=1 Tax=Kolteria novifilia TaxID=2527975 RepID=A0A518B6J4_9BACT|nr:hypothetical protein Pan216_34610 [Planctomycetes bacterium Pan216]
MRWFVASLVVGLLGTGVALADDFTPIFNGKSLEGWKGDPKIWRVDDGVIVGETKDVQPLPYNKFLIYEGSRPKNFELRLKAKLTGKNNSGIQYRATPLTDVGDDVVKGYQMDMHPNPNYLGMLYDERGRGIVAQHGQKVVIAKDGKRWLAGSTGPVQEVDPSEWNEYTIIANGNRLIHKINGKTSAEIIDHQEAERELEGVIAFQVHRGPVMTIEIKDVELKELPDGGLVSPDETPVPEGAKRLK